VADALNLTQNFNVDLVLPEVMWDEMSDTGTDPILAALPLVHEKEDLLLWDQYENGYGLLSGRGLGGTPDVTPAPGLRRYAVAPGYYGERAVLEETEMTKSRDPGTANLPAKPEERIAVMTQYQAEKSVNRVRQTSADLLRTGKFVNRSASGAVVHTDQIENYTAITAMPGYTLPKSGRVLGPSWRSDPGNARPLTDLDYVKYELELGTSSEFGQDSELVVNPDVLIDLLNTRQVQEVYKGQYGASVSGPADLERLFLGRGLPKLVPYKKGYFPTLADAVARTNFTRILPSGGMVWLGVRPKGQKLGKFVLTRNLGIDPPTGAKESPYKVAHRSELAWAEGIYILLEYIPKMPFRFELDVGLNGGPVVHFGSAAAGLNY
jgi:hypothetical protein